MLRSKLFAAGLLASLMSPAAALAADVEYVREKRTRVHGHQADSQPAHVQDGVQRGRAGGLS